MVVFAPSGWYVGLAALLQFFAGNVKFMRSGVLGWLITLVFGAVQGVACVGIAFAIITQVGDLSSDLSAFVFRVAAYVALGALAVDVAVALNYRMRRFKTSLGGSIALLLAAFPLVLFVGLASVFIAFRMKFNLATLQVVNLVEGAATGPAWLCLFGLGIMALFVAYSFVWQICVIGLPRTKDESILPLSSTAKFRQKACSDYAAGTPVFLVMLLGPVLILYAVLSASDTTLPGFVYIGLSVVPAVTLLACDVARCNISLYDVKPEALQ